VSRFIDANLDQLRAALRSEGALLLRGFGLDRADAFAEASSLLSGGPLGESYEGPSPRQQLAPAVYNASEVWGALVIAEHAEMSYLRAMPRHLFLWCRVAAPVRGETTLVDARRVLARLSPDPDLRRLLTEPLRIRRRHAGTARLRDPFELRPWPAAFGTSDPATAVGRAAGLGYRAHIDDAGALTLESEQLAVRRHPDTGAPAFLNHVLVFHASSPAATLERAWKEDRELRALPLWPLARAYRAYATRQPRGTATDVSYADGSPIGDDVLAKVRAAVRAETHPLAWQPGDLAVVDNFAVLHGRRTFRGPRDVVVAWSDARA
jgi:Taurine catabolism dioxygenase TauD, TfdA family